MGSYNLNRVSGRRIELENQLNQLVARSNQLKNELKSIEDAILRTEGAILLAREIEGDTQDVEDMDDSPK